MALIIGECVSQLSSAFCEVWRVRSAAALRSPISRTSAPSPPSSTLPPPPCDCSSRSGLLTCPSPRQILSTHPACTVLCTAQAHSAALALRLRCAKVRYNRTKPVVVSQLAPIHMRDGCLTARIRKVLAGGIWGRCGGSSLTQVVRVEGDQTLGEREGQRS